MKTGIVILIVAVFLVFFAILSYASIELWDDGKKILSNLIVIVLFLIVIAFGYLFIGGLHK